MKLCKIILTIVLFILNNSFAAGIYNIYAVGKILPNDKLSLSARFIIDLPVDLKYILQNGIPIYFNLTYNNSKSFLSSYKLKFSRLLGNNNSIIEYKLTYHPLTKTYLVLIGTFQSEHKNLESALNTIGSISRWILDFDLGNWINNYNENFNIFVRLSLSISKLPNPYQINAITSDIWNLDSHWIKVKIQ